MQVLYDVRPPFVSFDGKQLQGSIGLRAQAVLERSGIAFELREIPVKRQLLMIEQNLSPVCSLARLKTVERLRTGVFSGTLAESPPYVAVVRRDANMPEPATLDNWAARPELRWGAHEGLYYSDFVQATMRKARAKILLFRTNHQHFANLLAARRIDFLILHEDEAQEMLKANGAGALTPLRTLTLADLRHGEQRFFYCSKRVPEASLRAINQALVK